MNLSKENFRLNPTLLTNIVFSLFPVSFIIGNSAVNINFFFFCCLGIYHLRSKILIRKFDFPLKVIFILFLLVLFSTSLNLAMSLYSGEYQESDFSRFIKSILFFRYFLILLIVYLLSDLDIISYKLFFLLAAFFPILISIDVIFQYIFGFNFLGFKGMARHNPSFFLDELISGGYIQNFSFFSILFLTNIIRKYNNFFKIFISIFIISILAIGIMLSGNRTPFFLFLIGLLFLFFFFKDFKKILLISYFIIYIIFGFITSSDVNMRNHYGGFFKNLNNAAVHLPKKIKNSLLSIVKDNEEFQKKDKWGADQPMLDSSGNPTIIDLELHPYKKLTLTALEVWKSNKIFGNGIKSFRFECHKIVNEQKRGLCSSHPHNYYMEILVDLGILGLICLTAIGLIFLVFIKKNYKIFKKENNLQNLLLLAAIISLFLEGFPLRSSGSFFSTNNTTHIILMSSIILSYKKLIKGKNFE